MATINALDNQSSPFTVSAGDLTVTAGNINIPNTTSTPTGTIAFGGTRFISNFGTANTFVGSGSGNTTLSGTGNSGLGYFTFNATTSSSNNAALGFSSLSMLTSGTGSNTSIGASSGSFLLTGTANTFVGFDAGLNYTSSESSNILVGSSVAGTIGESNTIRIGTQGSGSGQQNATYIAGISGITVSNQNLVTVNTATGQLGSIAAASSSVIGTAPGLSNIGIVGSVAYTPIYSNSSTATLINAQFVMPTAGTLSNLYVNISANASTTSFTVTLNKNGSTTALVATCTGLTTGVFSDTTHSVTCLAGDLITFQTQSTSVGVGSGCISMKITA